MANSERREESATQIGEPYTLTIVFRGVVCLVPQFDSQGNAVKLWALLPDLRSPKTLPKLQGANNVVADFNQVPAHEARLVIPEHHFSEATGVLVQDGYLCTEGGSAGPFKSVRLEDFHWELAPPCGSTKLQIPNPDPPDHPTPKTGEENYFGWTLPIDEVTKHLVGQSPAPKLEPQLFKEPYKPHQPWMAARLAFNCGDVTARRFLRDYAKIGFPVAGAGKFPRTVLSEVRISRSVQGEVTFEAKRLDGTKLRPQELPKVVLSNKTGENEVTVYVDHQPNVPCSSMGQLPSHFKIFYSLYQPSDVSKFQSFPEPYSVLRVLNVQCSPVTAGYP